MNEFDVILEECVDLIASGETSLEECLSNYPEYAAQLEPILITLLCLQEEGRDVVPPPALRARIRGELEQVMKDNPKEKSRIPVFFWQMALSVSVLALALVMTSTVFAQEALPGERLYTWKLASENLWRVVAVDTLGADLKLSDRRVNEYVAVSSDEQRRTEVLLGYNKLLVRFKNEQDESERVRILSVLKSQQDSLHNAGLSIPELDDYFSRTAGGNNAKGPVDQPVP
jgi:hypothetical protein